MVTYVSSIKKTMSKKTRSEYIDPIPYAHRQEVRATKKPKAKGERKGETRYPIVHMLSFVVRMG